MKSFLYDTLLNEENICNLENEKQLLLRGVLSKKKLVVYGKRNCGKTSLVKNVIIPEYKAKHKKSFVMFVDLMETKTLDTIHQRIKYGFEQAFKESFPLQNSVQNTKQFLLNLRPQIDFDPITNQPSISLSSIKENQPISFQEIFENIQLKISKQIPTLLVLDEFQDIAFVPEAQGLLRNVLQQNRDASIILMGSKRHILSKIFSHPEAPLASFGEDIMFPPIDYKKYHAYIMERFQHRKLKINFEDCKQLQDVLNRCPESINIICSYLYEQYSKHNFSFQETYSAIQQVLERRRGRYEEYLSNLSVKDEELLISIAKNGPILHPNNKEFSKTVNLSNRAITLKIKAFFDRSILEKTKEGYAISDSLLNLFLKKFR